MELFRIPLQESIANELTPSSELCCKSCVHAIFFIAWEYRSLPLPRTAVKRTNSEPSSIALQVDGLHQQSRANRSHGDLNSVEHKPSSEIPTQFTINKSGPGGDSCSTSSSTSSPPSSPLPSASATNSASLSAQEELDQFPDSHFSFSGNEANW